MKLKRLFTPFIQFSNRLLPTQCLACGCTLYGELLCEHCHFDLPWSTRYEYVCVQCGLALSNADNFCGHCLHNPPAYSRSYIPFAYEYPLDSIIHRFKYRRKLSHGKLLGQLLAKHIQDCADNSENWQQPDIIISAPMHWRKRWQRGFNQADILGEYLAEKTNTPLATKCIRRKAQATTQKESTRVERQQNLRDAFYISDNTKQQIKGKKIALVDDVVTTTATLREISRLLISAGVSDIQVWALARTMEK